jgi:ankyrin repeat protein
MFTNRILRMLICSLLPALAAGLSFTAHGQNTPAEQQLWAAIDKGDLAGAQAALDQGASLAAKNYRDDTPLIYAADSGLHKVNLDLVKLLLNRGAEIGAKNSNGDSAFSKAIAGHNVELARLLLNHGVDVNESLHTATEHYYKSPLYYALGDPAMVKLLLEHGAKTTDWGEYHISDYQVISDSPRPLFAALKNYDLEEFQLMLGYTTDLEMKDNINPSDPHSDQWTLISAAVDSGDANIEAVKLLLEHGAKTETYIYHWGSIQEGDTPLQKAIARDDEPMARLLLDHKANPGFNRNDANWQANYRAPVQSAAEANLPGMVRLLLEHGADPNDAGTASNSTSPEFEQVRKILDAQNQFIYAEKRGAQPIAAYQALLKIDPGSLPIRQKIIQLALARPALPPVPVAAQQNLKTAVAQLQASATDPQALDAAIASLGQVLLAAPWSAEGYYDLARALELKGDFAEAQRQLGLYLLLQPNDAKARARLEALAAQEIYAAMLARFRQSPCDTLREELIRRAPALPTLPATPAEAQRLFDQATELIHEAAAPAALATPADMLNKALDQAPWWANAYYNLSLALEGQGRTADAMVSLQRYLELKPDDKARAHLAELQQKAAQK